MSEEGIPAGEIIKIEPDGKYILLFPMRLTGEEITRYKQTLDDWLEGEGNPILMIDGGVQLVKLERYDGEEVKTKGKKKAGKKDKA